MKDTVQYNEDGDYKEKAFLKENKSNEGKSVIYLPNYNILRESWRPSSLVQNSADR